MNEKQAWNNFAQTGKIEDYIKYTQIRNQNRAQTAGAQTAGAQTAGAQTAGAQAVGEPPAFFGEVQGADQNRRTYHSGADGGGKRPSGDDPHEG